MEWTSEEAFCILRFLVMMTLYNLFLPSFQTPNKKTQIKWWFPGFCSFLFLFLLVNYPTCWSRDCICQVWLPPRVSCYATFEQIKKFFSSRCFSPLSWPILYLFKITFLSKDFNPAFECSFLLQNLFIYLKYLFWKCWHRRLPQYFAALLYSSLKISVRFSLLRPYWSSGST